jgi:hypothetical protein
MRPTETNRDEVLALPLHERARLNLEDGAPRVYP